MKKLILLIVIIFLSCSNETNAWVMSEDFILEQLSYGDEAEFSSFDCSTTNEPDGSYTVLRKVEVKNGFGVKSEYVFKLNMSFIGGNSVDIKNWKLNHIDSEK